jgi:cytochrome b subunit of formate dehydrogenase
VSGPPGGRTVIRARNRALGLVFLGIALACGAPAWADGDEGCVKCHTDAALAPGHLVDRERLGRSVHKGKTCTDCHFDYEVHPHPASAETVRCTECHESTATKVAASAHGPRGGEGEAAASCSDCHGVHDVFRATSEASRLHPLNVTRTCSRCHSEHGVSGPGDRGVESLSVADLLRLPYVDDTHGRALLRSGLVVAPTCVTCHGAHDILGPAHASSSVHHARVSQTCGTCHVGILREYARSAHARAVAAESPGGRAAATCTSCHVPHGIQVVDQHFKLAIIDNCTSCHGDRGRTYRGTYHGRVTEIGSGGVASCDDCHTAHSILPSRDPLSSVHVDHRTMTCAKCHEGATDEFARYQVHADPGDRANYPVLYWAEWIMRMLILVTWSAWGIHSALWLFRLWRERDARKAVAPREPTGRWYRRWPWMYRAIHLLMATSFLLLALTGLPLRYSSAEWSGAVFWLLGGAANVRMLHRLGAVLTLVYVAMFLGMILVRWAKREKGLFRGPTTLLPRLQDLRDVGANLRWFVRGGPPPKFDRWTYWERFDFLAEVWGVAFIGITGLVMWFPVFFTRFLPGEAINLAHVLHSYEALLATGFIFSVHFFNANLRPGKFPVDPVFLTGRISEEEFRHERPLEYERMAREGRLESEAMPPPRPPVLRRARVIGVLLLSFGLLLLALMLAASV